MSNLRLGLMGGAFDPIHFGHLFIAEAAAEKFGLDKVLFVPSGRPPHKRRLGSAGAEDRYAMTKLAIASNPKFAISHIELDRTGYSYSVDTVSAFLQEFGMDTQIYFITGADAILDVATWYEAEKLLYMCRFIAATRPGFDLNGLLKLPEHWREKISQMETPLLEISSTDIRSRVAEGRTIKYLLPEEVEEYIYSHGLYLESGIK